MYNLKSKSLPVLLAALLPTAVLASPHDSGAYVEGNIGTLYSTTTIFGKRYSQMGSVGINLNGGYQFGRYFATELGYTNYALNKSMNSTDLAIKGILPISVGQHDFNLFAKAGPAVVFNAGGGDVLAMIGAGAGYALTPKLDVTVQAQTLVHSFVSFGLLSAGLSYHFG